MNIGLLIFFAAILIVGGLVLVVITLTKGGGSAIDQDKYRSNWLKIEQTLQKDQTASYHLTVLNADKLLDQAMKDLHVKGQTMGERLKVVTPRLKNRNATWAAHKLRNQIAHETDVQVSYDTARRALASFKQALRDIGAI